MTARPRRILNVVGARPNLIKIVRLLEVMRADSRLEPLLCHTGQHYSEELSGGICRELGIPAPDFALGVGSGSHAAQTAAIMTAFEPVLAQARPDLVLVVGDVNSTLACALVAVKCGVPVAHVEAGLRAGDFSMPEEINRLLTDRLSHWLFTTCADADRNLLAEGVDPRRIHFVGNVMIDTLERFRPAAAQRDTLARFAVAPRRFHLLTLHRPSNVDRRETLEPLLDLLIEIAREYPMVFPVHPRTRAALDACGLRARLAGTGLCLSEPLGYLDFLNLEAQALVVFTDSGGVQEETTMLGTRCLTLRENTERPITAALGTNVVAGVEPARVRAAYRTLLATEPAGRFPELWDGHASERIAEILATDPLPAWARIHDP